MPDRFSTSVCSCWCVTFSFSFFACTCTASALTMKMMTSTRKTSVSGVMLISAKIDSPPSSGTPSSASGSFPIAIAVSLRVCLLGLVLGLDVDLVDVGPLGLLRAARLRIARALEEQLEKLVGQELHLDRDPVRT